MITRSASLRAMLVGAALLVSSAAAMAEGFETCLSRAEAAAEEWSNGRISPLSDSNTADPGNYVVIMYGKKYQAPYNRPGSVNIIRQFDGDAVSIRNKVYDDEYDRCMGYTSNRIYFMVSGK